MQLNTKNIILINIATTKQQFESLRKNNKTRTADPGPGHL